MSSAKHDQTLQDTTRRFKGAFYTPKIWVDDMHQDIENLIPGWRDDDKNVVWDSCAGSGNLTREYPIKNLILSSLLDSEVEILKQEQGDSAQVFKYDFLSRDELPPHIESMLHNAAAQNKRLIFLINPPYGSCGDYSKSGKVKTGIAESAVKKEMKAQGLGKPSNNLYIQFLYECHKVIERYGFKDYLIIVFCPISHFGSSTYTKFRKMWWNKFEFVYGYMFRASEFDGLSKAWAITLQVWRNGSTPIDKDITLLIKENCDD